MRFLTRLFGRIVPWWDEDAEEKKQEINRTMVREASEATENARLAVQAYRHASIIQRRHDAATANR